VLGGTTGYGIGKLFQKLRKQGKPWNHKRVLRVYRLMNLHCRKRTKKRRITREPRPLVEPGHPNETWSLDFMHDRMTNGAPFRVLNIIDDFNREVLNITVERSIGAKRVIRELQQLMEWRGKPESLRFDNGPEFIATSLSDNDRPHDTLLGMTPTEVLLEYGKRIEDKPMEMFSTFQQDDDDGDFLSIFN